MKSPGPDLSLVQSGKRRSYRLLMIFGSICLALHLLFIPLFLAANARTLAWFNIWSVLAWTAAGITLIQIEGISHASPPSTTSASEPPRRTMSALVAIISVAAYVWLPKRSANRCCTTSFLRSSPRN